MTTLWSVDHRHILQHAQQQDASKWIILLLVILTLLMCLIAIVLELTHLPNDSTIKYGHLALSLLTIISAWFFMHTVFAIHYAHDYYLASKRRVSIEYALMRGINDQAELAKLLAKRLNHYGDDWAHVNPIPLNPIEGSKWTASKPEDERRFLEILHNAGITATLRDTRGQDIDGACGQLAAKERD